MTLPNTLVQPVQPNYQLAAPMAAYTYVQYSDDDDIQALFMAINQYAQQNYVDFFNSYNLAIYTNPVISGSLLDWVGQGLYGIVRPYVSSGLITSIGDYATAMYGQMPYAGYEYSGSISVIQLNDDMYKRCMTWNLYKGDGNIFTVTWLKKRIVRWLLGVNGAPLAIDTTYKVGVSITNLICTITIRSSATIAGNNALPDNFIPDQVTPNAASKTSSSGSFSLADAQILQVLINSGILVLPSQYAYTVLVG